MPIGKPGSNPPQQFICGICHKPFFRKVTKNIVPLFCSKKCASRRQSPPMIPCPICKEMFKPTVNNRQYCSAICYYESKRINKPKVYIYEKCISCEKHYIPTRINQAYCSHKCYANSREKLSQKPCAYCDKIMVNIPKIIKKQKYCSYSCRNKARLHRITQNYKIKYRGKNWKEQASKARGRDNYTCQACGLYQIKPTLTVHHIKPYRDFNGDYKKANELNNLITLCRSCHTKVEKGKLKLPV